MEFKAQIMDASQMERSLKRITHEIIEKNGGAEHVCLVGIRRRGIPLAKELAENIEKFEGIKIPLGHVDITLYRDDLTEEGELPTTFGSVIPCDVKQYNIVIVDDVLFTGRTARAAIDAVFAFGRPKSIQLAALIDRGHRELPIRADYVGKNIPTSRTEVVKVMVDEIDGMTGVVLYNM